MDADMDEIKKQSIESLIDLADVRKFIQYEKGRFDLDRKAGKEARQLANGNAWRDTTVRLSTTLRHKVRVDAVNQIINKICSKFTSNPFRFISGDHRLPLDYNSYDTAIALAFRDSIIIGQGFIRCDLESHRAERLDAGSVMMDSTPGNSKYVICVEKEPKSGTPAKTDNLGLGDEIIPYNQETEQLSFIVYSKSENGIAVIKVANGIITDTNILPINEYPIIRISAEESWEKDRLTFRGLYHKAMGISDLIDFTFSKVASNILTQPRQKYFVPLATANNKTFNETMQAVAKDAAEIKGYMRARSEK